MWPHDLGPTYEREHFENRQYWNFGCAQQRNLAAMVENPADLVQPRSEVPPYNGRRTTVLDKYHRGESTATQNPTPTRARSVRLVSNHEQLFDAAEAAEPSAEHIAPAPRVSVQAFCETVETAAAVQAAGEDRRLGRAHLKVQMGGIVAANEAYSTSRRQCHRDRDGWPEQ